MGRAPLPDMPAGIACVTEQPVPTGGGMLHAHAGWAAAWPWLVQGITDHAHDMSLFAGAPAGQVLVRWQQLRDRGECAVIVHARQVHGADVLVHDRVPAGIHVAPDADGHVTAQPGAMLAVSVADCVPVSLVAPEARVIALLHGGWRGVAAGILERGLRTLDGVHGVQSRDVHMHLGPAICGRCYEVGPDTVHALELRDGAAPRTHVDLRAVLVVRALAAGIPAAHMSVSSACTRCGESPFYSHRGGCAERQVAVLAIRGERA
jgi:polyphenol oxidase